MDSGTIRLEDTCIITSPLVHNTSHVLTTDRRRKRGARKPAPLLTGKPTPNALLDIVARFVPASSGHGEVNPLTAIADLAYHIALDDYTYGHASHIVGLRTAHAFRRARKRQMRDDTQKLVKGGGGQATQVR